MNVEKSKLTIVLFVKTMFIELFFIYNYTYKSVE
jgi:hypothetical protein